MEILRPRHYSLIEIGGATLSTSLIGIGIDTSLIIDPLFDTITKPLIELIKNNQFEEIPKWLRGLNIYDEFSSNMDYQIANFYRHLATHVNFNSIYGLNGKVGSRKVKERSFLVVCNFPHPSFMSPTEIVESAKIITGNKGQLGLVTENLDYILSLIDYLKNDFRGKVTYKYQFIERNPQQVPISLYDMILGMPNYYYAEVVFGNKNDFYFFPKPSSWEPIDKI
jgi:hypothetical protein